MSHERPQFINPVVVPRRPQVLIADDDPSCLGWFSEAFGRLGLPTAVCRSGRQAWEKIHEPPGVLVAVLNWMLPDLDGLWIYRRLRQQNSSVVTALLIGRSFLPEARTRLDLPAQLLLSKPLVKSCVDRQIGDILRLAAGPRPLWQARTSIQDAWMN